MAKEGNSINAKIEFNSDKFDRRFRKKGPNQQLTLDTITKWIKIQGLDDYTTNGLIELASTYPTSALPNFRKNFNIMLARVRQKRKIEQQGFEQENHESNHSDLDENSQTS